MVAERAMIAKPNPAVLVQARRMLQLTPGELVSYIQPQDTRDGRRAGARQDETPIGAGERPEMKEMSSRWGETGSILIRLRGIASLTTILCRGDMLQRHLRVALGVRRFSLNIKRSLVLALPILLAAVIFISPGLAASLFAQEFHEFPPGITAVESHFAPTALPDQFRVVQALVVLPPGAVVPAHSHGGRGYVTVLEGVVLHYEGDHVDSFGPGDYWIEEPWVVGHVEVVSDVPARLLVTFTLPVGAPLMVIAE
jgi:quercetin dioxygenase-like cupin family protein